MIMNFEENKMSDFEYFISIVVLLGLPIVGACVGALLYFVVKRSWKLNDDCLIRWSAAYVLIPGFIGLMIDSLIICIIFNGY